jgi:branched-chain amino acid transport system substrate-binding protein
MPPVLDPGGIGRHRGGARRAAAAAAVATVALAIAACGNDWGNEPQAMGPGDTARAADGGSAGGDGTAGSAGTTGDDAPGGTGGTGGSGQVVPVDAPGVTDTEIRVGGVASVTNPLGGSYAGAFDGVQAYFDMVNSEGGVHGRRLVLASTRDDNVANNRNEVQGLLSQDDVFAVLPVASLLFTGSDLLVQQGVPTFGWTINPEWQGSADDPRTNLFGQAGSYLGFSDPSPVVPWLAQEIDAEQVGVLAYAVPQSADCAAGVENSIDEYGDTTGTELAYRDTSLSYGVSDLSVQVSAMKDAGVDLVTTCMDTNGVVTLAREMRQQRLDAVQWLPNAYDHDFVAEFGDLFEGSYVRTDFVQWEVDDPPPGLEDYLRWMEAGGFETSENSMVGWLNADLFVTGLREAGPAFDRRRVIEAINELTDYTAGGLLDGVDWTTQHTAAADRSCEFVSRIEDSEFVPVFSRPREPFVCADVEDDAIVTGHSG